MRTAIGFATQYYTLWEIYTQPVYASNTTVNGVPPAIIGYNHDCYYQKNISMDRAKVEELYPGVDIDMELKGHSRSFKYFKKVEALPTCFSFGKLEGQPIETSTDVWQLKRALGIIPGQPGEKSKRRRVLARRQLVALWELLRYPHTYEVIVGWKDEPDGTESPIKETRRSTYATPFDRRKMEEKKASLEMPYFFEDGKRIELEVNELKRFGFEGSYGYVTILVMETTTGEIVKYMGTSPPKLTGVDDDGNEVFTKIKATVEHKEYKGAKETMLKRIKICTKKGGE